MLLRKCPDLAAHKVGETELFRNRGPGFHRKIAGRNGKLLEISGWEARFSLNFVSHRGKTTIDAVLRNPLRQYCGSYCGND
jgi:hypothetical protein